MLECSEVGSCNYFLGEAFLLKNLIAAAIVAVASISGAFASTYPSFQFDAASSSIDLTLAGSIGGTIGLSASFTADAYNLAPWTPTGPNDHLRVNEFISWSSNTGYWGASSYNVVATLAFSSPDVASGSTSGSAYVAKVFGSLTAGLLTWNGPGSISFAQGSVLDFYLDPAFAFGHGNTVTTGVTFKGNDIAPVPLPATALLLLSGVAGIGLMRRRKTAA
jgi:hypothetical protein